MSCSSLTNGEIKEKTKKVGDFTIFFRKIKLYLLYVWGKKMMLVKMHKNQIHIVISDVLFGL